MKNSDLKKSARKKYKIIRKNQQSNIEPLIIHQINLYLKQFYAKSQSKPLIGIYWPLFGEIDLRSLKKSLQVSLALPACNTKGEISYRRWTKKDLTKDAYGIPAPLSENPLQAEEISTLLIPTLAIDHSGTRLGYGGGCFDRLRVDPLWKAVKAFAILPHSCISKTLLPKDKWDIPLDGWINEKEIFQINHLKY